MDPSQGGLVRTLATIDSSGPDYVVWWKGKLIVSGWHSHCLYAVSLQDGRYTVYAGKEWEPGNVEGCLLKARFRNPSNLVVDPTRRCLLIRDASNSCVKIITNDEKVLTIAKMDAPIANAVDPFNGQTYVGVHPKVEIFRLDQQTGERTLLLPRGLLVDPYSMAVDPEDGSLVFADRGANCIKRYDFRKGSIVAGKEVLGSVVAHLDGDCKSARFSCPSNLAIASNGIILVTDSHNNCIRMIKDGVVSTIAGIPHKSGRSDSTPLKSKWATPHGIAIVEQQVVITDFQNHTIRVFTLKDLPVTLRTLDLSAQMSHGLDSKKDTAVIGNGTAQRVCHEAYLRARWPSFRKPGANIPSWVDQATLDTFCTYLYSNKIPPLQKGESYLRLLIRLNLLADSNQLPFLSQLCEVPMNRILHDMGRESSASVASQLVYFGELAGNITNLAAQLLKAHLIYSYHREESKMDLRDVERKLSSVPGGQSFFGTLTALKSPPVPKPQPTPGPTEPTPEEAFSLLFAERNFSGDWKIVTFDGTCATEHRCHSFVLCAIWPYFDAMCSSHMVESGMCALRLPTYPDDGGLTGPAVEAVLALIYGGKNAAQVLEQLSSPDVQSILDNAGLYGFAQMPQFEPFFEALESL